MKSKRSTIRQCKHLAKEHVDNPDEPAAPTGDSGFAEWVQISLILLHTELNKSFWLCLITRRRRNRPSE
jgi:hypothetical protein